MFMLAFQFTFNIYLKNGNVDAINETSVDFCVFLLRLIKVPSLTVNYLLYLNVGRLWWAPDDPEYISDCLFALGNVLSFSRISYLMPAWELLGPLQISLARMVSDIIRFMALFTVVSDFLFAWDDNLCVSTHGLKRK